jgi:hypothetical protein
MLKRSLFRAGMLDGATVAQLTSLSTTYQPALRAVFN